MMTTLYLPPLEQYNSFRGAHSGERAQDEMERVYIARIAVDAGCDRHIRDDETEEQADMALPRAPNEGGGPDASENV